MIKNNRTTRVKVIIIFLIICFIQGGFINWSAQISVLKRGTLFNQSMRIFCTLRISWNIIILIIIFIIIIIITITIIIIIILIIILIPLALASGRSGLSASWVHSQCKAALSLDGSTVFIIIVMIIGNIITIIIIIIITIIIIFAERVLVKEGRLGVINFKWSEERSRPSWLQPGAVGIDHSHHHSLSSSLSSLSSFLSPSSALTFHHLCREFDHQTHCNFITFSHIINIVIKKKFIAVKSPMSTKKSTANKAENIKKERTAK